MSKKHQYKNEQDEKGEALDPFHEVLQVYDTEHLIRLRKKLEMVGRKKMVEILTTEIEERDEADKARAKAEHARIEEERKAEAVRLKEAKKAEEVRLKEEKKQHQQQKKNG
jgi:hypothetical protein